MMERRLLTLLFGGRRSVIWIKNNMPRETARLQSQADSLLIKAG